MTDRQKGRIFICCLLLAALVFTAAAGFFAHQQFCMGVRAVSAQMLQGLTEIHDINLAQIFFNGTHAAADHSTGTLYISQAPDRLYHYSAMEGLLTATDPSLELCFLKDDALKDPAASVKNGTPLSLVVVRGKQFQRVKVVITTLPVLSLSGETTQVYKDYREIFKGSVALWASNDPGSGSYTTQTSATEYHVRGASSANLAKKPWKLGLKTNKGKNADLNLLGMGADDDWILNPMNLDDTKVREMLCTTLWNSYIYKGHDGYSMSTCEYIEVIHNGEYQGLYLLQRRVDEKYLQLNKQTDLLFKCINSYEDLGIRTNYETIHSAFDADTTYSALETALANTGNNQIDLESYLDMNLTLQFLALRDNRRYKNMFYALRAEDSGYSLFFVPWDTDQSTGLRFTDTFRYDYDDCMAYLMDRMEQPVMEATYPQLSNLQTQRWQKLRSSAFSKEVTTAILDENIALIQNSGAYGRDVQKWGLRYDGADTHEALYRWCTERRQFLDAVYGK